MSLTYIVQSLLDGLLLGGVYSLVAIGLSLIFGVMKVINFAHGTLMMLGMYSTYWAFAHFHPDNNTFVVRSRCVLPEILDQSHH
jgi:branched-subunit amino acid ABC-type transport system permease component